MTDLHVVTDTDQPTDLAATLHDQLTSLADTWKHTDDPMNNGHGTSTGRALPSSTITLRADITLTLAYWIHAMLDRWPAILQRLEQRPVPTTDPDHTGWTLVTVTDTLDCTDVVAMAELLDRERHRIVDWDDYALTLVTELQPLVDHARLVARPPRRDKIDVGPCPTCGRSITAKAVRWVRLPIPTSDPNTLAPWTPYQPAHDQVITCKGCRRQETLLGWQKAIVGVQRMLSADELVEHIHAELGMRYSPITIRVWARRGFIQAKGYMRDGRAVYDRVQVFAALMERESTRRGA